MQTLMGWGVLLVVLGFCFTLALVASMALGRIGSADRASVLDRWARRNGFTIIWREQRFFGPPWMMTLDARWAAYDLVLLAEHGTPVGAWVRCKRFQRGIRSSRVDARFHELRWAARPQAIDPTSRKHPIRDEHLGG